MIEDGYDFDGVDTGQIKSEKHKARKLRKTGWWQRKIAHGVCHYCGGRFTPKELTMDHFVPLARGGTSSKGNLVPCCKECNTRKRSMLPIEWQEYMDSLERG